MSDDDEAERRFRVMGDTVPVMIWMSGADKRCDGLAEAYEQIARELGCGFFDAGKVTTTSKHDGIHLDAEQHAVLGRALAEHVAASLTDTTASGWSF